MRENCRSIPIRVVCSTQASENGSRRREDRVAEERFIAYTACCCAKETLIVSYSSKSAQGEELSESEIITFIREHFPQVHQTDTLTADKIDLVEGKKPAFELTAALMRNGGELYESLRKYLE